MRSRQVLLAVILGWVIPGVMYVIAENIHLNNQGHMLQSIEDTTTPTSFHLTQTTEPEKVEEKVTEILILQQDGGIQKMALEDYIVCVVLGEMPADFEMEALKAQSVVARTYTLKRYTSQQKHESGAVCTDYACCQAFTEKDTYLAAGHTQAQLDRVEEAVQATKDLVLTYDGGLIEATYFSCSGGRTEEALAVWGSDVPYLQSVESPGEEYAKYHVDTVTFSAETFQQLLGTQLPGLPETWLGDPTYTAGGGVERMRIGEITYAGTELRQLLGLRSTAFYMTAVGENIIVTTKGFGHRVGMSQYGADAMAVSGSGFEEISTHYYPGTTLESWCG